MFEDAARAHRERIALEKEDVSVSYGQALDRVSNLANSILHHTPGQEQFIAISATRSIETILGILAILKAGRAYLPLDSKYPEKRLQQLVTDSGVKFVLCLTSEKAFFESIGLVPIIIDVDHALPEIVPTFQSPVVCVLYTSGSTGNPKGVCLGHQGLVNQINWQKEHDFSGPGVKSLQFSHLSFDGAFLEIFVPLTTGGTLVLINDRQKNNISSLLQFIIENQINRLFLAYVVLQYLAETAKSFNLYPTSVRKIITGGELLIITPAIANLFHVLEEASLVNVYGPTETSVWVTEMHLKGGALNWPSVPPIGRLVAGASIYLVDADLKMVNDGETGEVLIAGECLALYYLNNEAQTAERFIQWQHPLLGALRVYRTGDRASLNADGTYQFQGRGDNQVKINGGYRVELSEVEIVIGKVAGVSQVKVIVREDRPGVKKIVAYVVLAPTAGQINETDLRREVSLQLPQFMVPDIFLVLPEFPFTVSGKIDVLALPKPESYAGTRSGEFKSASGETQIYLKGLWEQLFAIKDIGIDDDFFNDLGGSSLIAIQMMSRIERDRGKQLPLVSVFDYRTIAKLAQLLDNAEATSALSTVVAIKSTGSRIPIYLVPGDNLNVLNFSGLAKHVHEDQPLYGLQPKGLDGRHEPLDTIEAIAAYYNKAILLHNGNGPYAVAGHSFGGYVALEMAHQLHDMGKQVVFTGLFDTDAFNAERNLGLPEKIRRKIKRQIPKFLWIAKSFIASPSKTIYFQRQTLKQRLGGYLPLRQQYVSGTDDYYRLMDKINAVHHRALFKYRLKRHHGTITVFNAMERNYFIEDSEFLGWKRYAAKGVKVHKIPGDHITMFKEPNCKTLAVELEKALADAGLK